MNTSQKHRPSLARVLGFRAGEGLRETSEREAAAELGFDHARVTAWQEAFAEGAAARQETTPQGAFTEGEATPGEAPPVKPPALRPARRLARIRPSRRSREELEQEAARELELVASRPQQG